ncbi:PilZ domain-containing protein [Desulfobulbus sp. F4]|nr:PilZ domain-containing protein [Desulfobulbus sp. F4]
MQHLVPCWTEKKGGMLDAGFKMTTRCPGWESFFKNLTFCNNRAETRKRAPETLLIDIEIGHAVYTGKISDLSQFGLQIRDLPLSSMKIGQTCNISVMETDRQRHFSLKASIIWQQKKGYLFGDAGFKIIGSDTSWNDFFQQMIDNDCERRMTERVKPKECLYILSEHTKKTWWNIWS